MLTITTGRALQLRHNSYKIATLVLGWIQLFPQKDPNTLKHMVRFFTAYSIPYGFLTTYVGTGTPAGDPIEAEAIATAFFPNDGVEQCNSDPLLVGGIKTVIGHSESVAGLAGVIKVSLALQNAIVPPNLLFSEISPKVEPFYQHLRIPTSAVPWPMVQDGAPRRASVNW